MSGAQPQDLDLLRLYSTRGDARAFAELVRRYADMVYATARRVTGDAATAQDVSQDCFLSLAQRSASIRGSLAAWLHRTSVNRSLELQRTERARRRREAQAAVEHRIAGARDDSAAQLIAQVDAALASLPHELRVLVTEHYLCGRTEADLAAQAGVSQSTIHRKLDKALERLRRRLRGSDDEEPPASLAPMLLGMASEKAPMGLQRALLKIGLSGVAGDAVPTASVVFSARKLIRLAFVLIAALTASLLLYLTRPPVAPPAGNGPSLAFDELPAAVQQVVRARAPLSPPPEIEKKHLGNRTVYDVDFDAGGKHHELRIAEDGTVIWQKPQ
jgi:RNA polymerase sigma-70 factor (ECF subfamily)